MHKSIDHGLSIYVCVGVRACGRDKIHVRCEGWKGLEGVVGAPARFIPTLLYCSLEVFLFLMVLYLQVYHPYPTLYSSSSLFDRHITLQLDL